MTHPDTNRSERVVRSPGHPLLSAIHWISTISGWAAAGMIVAAVGITCQMIYVRFVLNFSTVWQTEVVVYLMVGATLVGLPYVQRHRGHVNVNLLPLALPPGARFALALVTQITSIIVIGIMVIYGYEMWHVAWARGWTSDTVWAAKLWVPYLAVPVGFGLFLLQMIGDLVALIMGYDRPFDIEDD